MKLLRPSLLLNGLATKFGKGTAKIKNKRKLGKALLLSASADNTHRLSLSRRCNYICALMR